jgi:hypothetical protein
VALENIARRLTYPCAIRQSRCLDLFPIEHIAEHHVVCVYGNIKCPFQIQNMCSWNGLKSDFKESAKAARPKNVFKSSALRSPQLSCTLGILSCFDDLFTYYQQIHDGRLYGAVQLTDTNSEASKYKRKIKLLAANGIEMISCIFLVRCYSEGFEPTLNSRRYLCLDEETVRCSLIENKLNLTVTLTKV